MSAATWTGERLLGVSGQFWESCALQAGVKTDLFTCIGSERLAAEEVAQRCRCDARGMAALLAALAAMGLLEKRAGRFANTPAGAELLVKGTPGFLGHLILHHHYLMPSWAHLDQAVSSGKPLRSPEDGEEDRRAAFLLGMRTSAGRVAPQVVPHVDLTGKRRLLDLGGGPGTYAIAFCRAYPGIQATVFDLPTSRPFAEETIAAAGLSERIDFAPGDVLVDPLPGRYDAVWISHLLHSQGPDACRRILRRAAAVLEPQGSLLVHEFLLDDSPGGPVFPALFALNMLVRTDAGRAYSVEQLMELMAAVGLQEPRCLPFRGPQGNGIVIGKKGEEVSR